jgi:hypothetical protein|tara:strand:- start:948 stop:3065 length:2118 start_codon:yes stop_codon:yes gene_type:complete
MTDYPETPNDVGPSSEVTKEAPGLAGYIEEKFFEAEQGKQSAEIRHLRAYRDYRGIYDPETRFRTSEKSRVFIKIAKTKTLAAYGQLIEVIFSGSKFPIGIQATDEPMGIADKAHLPDPAKENQPQDEDLIPPDLDVGYAGDGDENAGGRLSRVLGGLQSKFGKLDFLPGKGHSPKEPTISPAAMVAQNMEKKIHDQLTGTKASRELRSALFESALYGTGIVKGPFSYKKNIHRWDIESSDPDDEKAIGRAYNPIIKTVPQLAWVSVWDFYPDPNATTIDDAEYVIQRHKLTKSQMRDLVNRPYFNEDELRTAIARGPNYEKRGFEDSLRESTNQTFQTNRYECFEFWGVIDTEFLINIGADYEYGLGDLTALDEMQVNVWTCGENVLRFVINPFEPDRIPYNAFPYEDNPHDFWGVGVPENMADSTIMMNGHARMAIDNLAISGNLVFDIDETALVPGQPFEMYPGKVFRRQAGQSGQAVYGLKFPNTTRENMEMFDRFRQIADEATGLPSYSHGQTGVQSTTRTASGMSMLMGAAALNIKTVIKNVDDYLLKPLGEAMFFWNMQFSTDSDIQGDLEVKALGTESVMRKEVMSQRLIQFLQIASNPILAPFTKLHNVLKEVAKMFDLDEEEFTNNPEEAMIFARLLGEAGALQGQQGQGGSAPGPQGPKPPGISSENIQAPSPGEQGFSAAKESTSANTAPVGA